MTLKTSIDKLRRDVGELVAKHEQTQSIDDFSRYRDDPVGFIREVLKGEPWSMQEEIAAAVLQSPLTIVRSCNGAGKDWVAAHLALWWVYARRGLVLLTGPTERQVREIVMGEVARAWTRAHDLPGELYQMALRLGRSEQAGIIAFTSTEASRLTGFHAPRVMAVLTEAQGVEDFAWEGILACAVGPEDRVLAVGNPLSPSGRFFAASRSKGWSSLQISALEHPNITEGREVIPGGPSQAFVGRIAGEYGVGSSIYSARVLGEFPDEGEESLFRRSWLDDAADRHARCIFALQAHESQPVVAVDPARYGPDATVAAVKRGPVIERIVSWRNASTMATVAKMEALAQNAGVKPRHTRRISRADRGWLNRATEDEGGSGLVVVDVVGLGAGVADRMKELGYRVKAFNGGSKARKTAKFLNLRAESYWRLRELLEAGEIALPPDEELFSELLALKWRPTAAGQVQLESKDGLRGRLGRSPDRADAVSMVFWARATSPVPSIVKW